MRNSRARLIALDYARYREGSAVVAAAAHLLACMHAISLSLTAPAAAPAVCWSLACQDRRRNGGTVAAKSGRDECTHATLPLDAGKRKEDDEREREGDGARGCKEQQGKEEAKRTTAESEHTCTFAFTPSPSLSLSLLHLNCSLAGHRLTCDRKRRHRRPSLSLSLACLQLPVARSDEEAHEGIRKSVRREEAAEAEGGSERVSEWSGKHVSLSLLLSHTDDVRPCSLLR